MLAATLRDSKHVHREVLVALVFDTRRCADVSIGSLESIRYYCKSEYYRISLIFLSVFQPSSRFRYNNNNLLYYYRLPRDDHLRSGDDTSDGQTHVDGKQYYNTYKLIRLYLIFFSLYLESIII